MVLEALANLLGDKEPKPNKFTVAMGELIRKAREEAGLSQTELADYIYRRRATVSDLESGKHEPDASTLALIAAAVDKPIIYFYPNFLSIHVTPEELTAKEQELIMVFREIKLEELETIAINLVRVITSFEPVAALERWVDFTKERHEIREELKRKRNK